MLNALGEDSAVSYFDVSNAIAGVVNMAGKVKQSASKVASVQDQNKAASGATGGRSKTELLDKVIKLISNLFLENQKMKFDFSLRKYVYIFKG